MCRRASERVIPKRELSSAAYGSRHLHRGLQHVGLYSQLEARYFVMRLKLPAGARLPSEELAGTLPSGSAARQGRAYLSNVCTAPGARRQGIAAALVAAAVAHARAAGVQQLYVHVMHRNAAARQLYVQRCGFVVQQEEGEAQAVALSRPTRMLLCLRMGLGGSVPPCTPPA